MLRQIKSNSKKLLIVGIDGADWQYINYGISKNKLPTIKKIMQKGCYGKVKSVIPPTSFLAWTCICSGKNPGKIGHFGYMRKIKNSYKTEVRISDALFKTNPFWEKLNENKIKVGIVNIPSAYKPMKTDEFMVCLGNMGDSIPKDGYRCYPKELGNLIIKNLGELEYETHFAYFNKPEDQQIKESLLYLKNRSKLNEFLLAKYKSKINLFMPVFLADRLQHVMIDPEKIMKYYIKVDKEIKQLMSIYKPDNTLLISDHGGGKTKKNFYVNEFLIKNGFLKIKKIRKKFLSNIGINLENIQKILAKLKLDAKTIKILPTKFIENCIRPAIPIKELSIEDAEIDWSKTSAYAVTDSAGIYINLKGREPEGIISKKKYELVVQDIINKLKNLKDPETNKKIKMEVYKKEEIYHGKYVDESPDIVYSLDEGAYVPKLRLSGEIFKNPRDIGNHKQYGVIIGCGQDIKKGKIDGGEIIDFAPTILRFFNIKKPKDMDGKVLDIFK